MGCNYHVSYLIHCEKNDGSYSLLFNLVVEEITSDEQNNAYTGGGGVKTFTSSLIISNEEADFTLWVTAALPASAYSHTAQPSFVGSTEVLPAESFWKVC